VIASNVMNCDEDTLAVLIFASFIKISLLKIEIFLSGVFIVKAYLESYILFDIFFKYALRLEVMKGTLGGF